MNSYICFGEVTELMLLLIIIQILIEIKTFSPFLVEAFFSFALPYLYQIVFSSPSCLLCIYHYSSLVPFLPQRHCPTQKQNSAKSVAEILVLMILAKGFLCVFLFILATRFMQEAAWELGVSCLCVCFCKDLAWSYIRL